ncbi:alpha/beta hydrolase [Vibrio sp. SCSIO 43137]|uniref:alpha/beta hydrolase n=1 Tax=Vibrio sp. SCSIO 43137 TaxID=3021011 RepID=UPI0023070683|nr:alpha/beta fold hydrolase [Vibrio sp. SCSIO 43137]WCE32005.1 alpha/beta fold hydrolase [Vibrio sp. SCSIO 43137]
MKIRFWFVLSALFLFPSIVIAEEDIAVEGIEQNERFFSLQQLKGAKKQPLAPLEYVEATDGISLALRAYRPVQAEAVVIFYHGGGAHSGLSYQHIGIGLRDDYGVASYMPDIRGHGFSAGERGDAPSKEQVWRDISRLIEWVQEQHPQRPVFLAGHSAGAGLILNYSSWSEATPVAGYLFVAPYFGFRSETGYDKEDKRQVEFSSVNVSDFVINSMSGGLLRGHAKAVQFHYPQTVLEQNPKIVTFNTVNMSNAMTPESPAEQLNHLSEFALWIGDNDEAFDPDKVVRFASEHSRENSENTIDLLKGESHFSVLLSVSEYMGKWITQLIRAGRN